MPRVINVDKNPAYPAAVEVLKADGVIPRRVRLRQCKYLNNVIEQDHRSVKKRVWLAKGYGSFQSAWRTLQGIETVNMIRKSEMAAERRCGWPRDFHQRAVRTRCHLNQNQNSDNLHGPESPCLRTSQQNPSGYNGRNRWRTGTVMDEQMDEAILSLERLARGRHKGS